MAVDAHVYYTFIRHFRPKRIMEIGAGHSTLLAVAAGMRNLKENGEAPHLLPKPYPRIYFERHPSFWIRVSS
jgi:hypothetical protein